MDVTKTNYSQFLVVFLITLSPLVAGAVSRYVEEACSVTTHRDICIRSLASFSNEARRSPSKWARAGVSVTIGEIKGLVRYLVHVKKYGRWRGRSLAALSDCVEVVQDALDNLHQSLYVLRKLNTDNTGEFERQMSDVLTWLSAALTDEDICTEGLEEGRPRGRRGRGLRAVERRVVNASYMTSNALALANKLATSGFQTNVGVEQP